MRATGPGRRDGGFTVVEVLVAMMLLLVVATACISALLSTQKQLGAARQRQWATALAAGALEQLRSLPYPVVVAGLRSTDLAGDPYIVASGSGYHLTVPASAMNSTTGIDEPLVTSGTSSTTAPLYPHLSTPPAGTYPSSFGTPPSLGVYVTSNAADAGAVTLTAVVRWTPPGGTARLLVERTRLYSPPGSGGA